MDAKHQILNAAAALFARKGFSATSVREISRVAKVNLAMVNYYFKSKENLLESMMQSGIEAVMRELEGIVQQDRSELEKIDAVIDVHARYIFGNRDLAAILFQEQMTCSYPKSQALLQELSALNRRTFAALVTSGQKRKIFCQAIKPDLLYASLVGTIEQMVVLSSPREEGPRTAPVSVGELADYLKFMCRKLLKPCASE